MYKENKEQKTTQLPPTQSCFIPLLVAAII